MKLQQYTVETSKDNLAYEFYSECPKGKIKKVVLYERLDNSAKNIFNLGFGDWIDASQKVAMK